MQDHPYGWLSLLPPLLVIVLAIATRRIILSLFIGIAAGALIVSEAGGIISDRTGANLRFNNAHPTLNGVIAGGRAVHSALVDLIGPAPS